MRLASITGTEPAPSATTSAWVVSRSWVGGRTQVEMFDASQGASPKTMWNAVLDGHPVATRRIADRLYVVTRFVPELPGFIYGCASCNAAQIASTPLDKMLPTLSVNGAAPVPLSPAEVLSPPQGASLPSAEITTVTVFDLANPAAIQRLAIAGATEAIYVSPANLYVATTRNLLRNTVGSRLVQSAATYTDIHQIALGATLSPVGTATLEGYLGNDLDKTPFRLSESNGKLRAVTSLLADGGWGIQSNRNQLTILEPSVTTPGVLKTVSILPNPQRTAILGKPNEELYATRFVGDKLYAVTFTSSALSNQAPSVDPLYVVDLANAADPRIRGALEIPGYSDYLHPLPNGQLLGFGRVVTSTGIEQGLQLSLFDVADPDNPRVVQQIAIGERGSDSALLKSHHALSVIDRGAEGIELAFPARVASGRVVSGSGQSATYDWQESSLRRYRVKDGRLVEGMALSVWPKFSAAPVLSADHTASTGRSILMGNGAAVYVGNGRLWFQDPAGVASGPFN
jgi:uncharacterized secreted protein with C-terminal beta-propeller domain